MITSGQNQHIRYVRGLYSRKGRARSGKLVLEGVRLVEEAIAADVAVELALYSPRLLARERGGALVATLAARGVEMVEVADGILDRVAQTDSPQGIVAVAAVPDAFPDRALAGPSPLAVLVEDIQDPGNLGTIIRTADAAGAGAVLLTAGAVDPYGPKVLRASMGSMFHLAVARMGRDEALAQLRRAGLRIVAADPRAGRAVYDVDLRGPLAIAVGNEGAGLSEDLLALVDETAAVPMPGRAESLNVAVATGIFLYEAVRQRSLPGQ